MRISCTLPRRLRGNRYLSGEISYQKNHEANHKHQNGNLIDAVHKTEIQICFLFFEKVGRIEIIKNLSEDHGLIV